MLIKEILLIAGIIILSRLFLKESLYRWALFLFCLIAIYWFQPLSSIRTLDFWLPTVILFLVLSCWFLLFHQKNKEDSIALGIILVFFGLNALGKLFEIKLLSLIVSTPGIPGLAAAAILLVLASLAYNLPKKIKQLSVFIIFGFILIIFVVLKSNDLGLLASQGLRRMNEQLVTLASPSDIVWVGYSYFSFRLLHTIIDRKRIVDANLSLKEYFTFLVFFPAYIAGPIDRVEGFTQQLRSSISRFNKMDFINGLIRIIRGIFLKFILADSLGLFSLSPQSVGQIQRPVWTWIIVYGYAFRIFFDFAGYTDIAIGLGKLAGIQLPENFNQPYLSRNVTLFWNHWHITLTQWFRTYYFNPVTRYIRSNFSQIKPWVIIFSTQITTMLLIGLWHGISLNFILWGLWNGFGLFIHNRWSTMILPRFEKIKIFSMSTSGNIFSIALTFNFIALGWVWFALPTAADSIKVFRMLVGL
jgi:D-alanyl-lipoteichoic acid acyltransferase DltB (MBOAT superfamily)